jgi:hypothetical protein
MEKAPINFKQKRDFGEVINATFSFLGQEFKPLGKVILLYVLPVLIVAAILNVFVGIEQQKYLNSFKAVDTTLASNPFSMLGNVYKYTFLILLIYLVALSALRCTIYGYIKTYVEKGKDQFTTEDVWKEVRRFILPVLGTSIVVGLITGIGTLFCLLPGVYLGISLCLIYTIMIFEGKGMGDAFSRSFGLTKQDWWVTLGIVFISYIIVYVISLILSIPGMIMGVTSVFTSIRHFDQTSKLNFSTTYYIINSITSLLSYVLISIPFIAISFQYFSLVEQKERPSLQARIEQIG